MRLLAFLLLSATAAASPCPIIENQPRPLTKNGTAVGDGGGIVVAIEQISDGTKTPPFSAWRIDGKPAVGEHLAPGLDLVRTPGAGKLTDGKKLLVEVSNGGKQPLLDAPKVTEIVRDAPSNARHPYVQTMAYFATTAPAGTLAVIAYDDKGVARSWGKPEDKYVVIYSSGSCGFGIPGMVDLGAGDAFQLAYVDASGRVGKKSAAVKVKAK